MSTSPALPEPRDEHQRALVDAVHPEDWRNPTPSGRYSLVVIGAGTAGLVTAAGAAGLGARVALVERHRMGGDCLNTGCVPSKSLLRSAHAAVECREAAALGLRVPSVDVDFPVVMERLRRIRAGIAPHDSARRFKDLGVDVHFGEARFIGPRTVEVAGQRLEFARAVIATGGRPVIPDLPGLAEAQPLTSDTVFHLTALPARMAVLGGGPIGCELAQAFQRLGTSVTLIQRAPRLLERDEADAAQLVEQALRRDGVRVHLATRAQRVSVRDGAATLFLEGPAGATEVTVDQILVAAGRRPNLDGLGLEAAGVATDPRRGVVVDDFLRTSNPNVFACGDVCGPWQFTHAADFSARVVIQNALFAVGPFGRRRVSELRVPWATYTDPELAHVGLDPDQARAKEIAIDTFTVPFESVDRAVTDGDTNGFVRVHVTRGTDRIVGATVVGRGAGDLVSELTVAMQSGVGLKAIASTIHPYPTRAEAIRRLGDQYNRTRLTPRAKAFLAAFMRWRWG